MPPPPQLLVVLDEQFTLAAVSHDKGMPKRTTRYKKSFKWWCDNNVRRGFDVFFTAHDEISFLELPGSTWNPAFVWDIFRCKSISDDLRPQQVKKFRMEPLQKRSLEKGAHFFPISSILKLRFGHPSTSSHFWHENFPFRKLLKNSWQAAQGQGLRCQRGICILRFLRKNAGEEKPSLSEKGRQHQRILLQDDVPFIKRCFVCNLKMWIYHKHLTTINWSQLSPMFWWHLGLGDVDLGSCFLALKVWKKTARTKPWLPPTEAPRVFETSSSEGFRSWERIKAIFKAKAVVIRFREEEIFRKLPFLEV